MSTRSFLDTRVGTYSGLVMGPLLAGLGIYLTVVGVEGLEQTGIPRWLPGVLMAVYGLWRSVRAFRGLLNPAPEPEETSSGPEFNRTREAVAGSSRSHVPGEVGAAGPNAHTDKNPAQ